MILALLARLVWVLIQRIQHLLSNQSSLVMLAMNVRQDHQVRQPNYALQVICVLLVFVHPFYVRLEHTNQVKGSPNA